MAENSNEDILRARRVVDQIVSGEGTLEITDDLVVSDLQAEATEFNAELELLEDVGASVPAIRIAGDQLVPMALSLFFGRAYPFLHAYSWRRDPYFYDWAYYQLKSLRSGESGRDGIEVLSREEARTTFVSRATNFLASRIAGIRELGKRRPGESPPPSLRLLQRKGGATVGTPGCVFSVTTDNDGLRVFWSGAHRVKDHYFGHPTSPAKSVLQSGDYIFGVDGGAYGDDIQWDTKAVVTLPGIPEVHLNY